MDEMSDALPFFTAVNKNSSFTFYSYLLTHPIVAARLLKFASSGTTFELTQKPFFTVAPLTLGGLAAKFGFFPCSSNLDVNPLDTTSFSYLAANLRTYFAKQQLSGEETFHLRILRSTMNSHLLQSLRSLLEHFGPVVRQQQDDADRRSLFPVECPVATNRLARDPPAGCVVLCSQSHHV
jgi:hypothetical protein